MDDDDVAGAIAVRVGVFFGGAAVRGPAGVADAVGAIERVDADGFFEVAEFAGGAADGEVVLAVHDGDAGGIITAIFEAPQAVEDDRNGFTATDIANNPTHRVRIAKCGGWRRQTASKR